MERKKNWTPPRALVRPSKKKMDYPMTLNAKKAPGNASHPNLRDGDEIS